MKKMFSKIICSGVLLFTASYANATVSTFDIKSLNNKEIEINKSNSTMGFIGSVYSMLLNVDSTSKFSVTINGKDSQGLDLMGYGTSLISVNQKTKSSFIDSLINKNNPTLAFASKDSFTDTVNFGTLSKGTYLFLFGSNDNDNRKFLGLSNGVAMNLKFNVAAVPEPETYALMGIGLLSLLAASRRQQKSALGSEVAVA